MNIFLSWSGDRSKRVADALGAWLGQLIQAVEPWISTEIDKGARWNQELVSQLAASEFGILCLTKDNLDSTWLHFEAGALAKQQDGRACTFLLDVSPTEVKPPLSQFQATGFEKNEMFKLVVSINNRLEAIGERSLKENALRSLFETLWLGLEAHLSAIAKDETSRVLETEKRTVEDLLDEVVGAVRRIESMLEHERSPRLAAGQTYQGVGPLIREAEQKAATQGALAQVAAAEAAAAGFGPLSALRHLNIDQLIAKSRKDQMEEIAKLVKNGVPHLDERALAAVRASTKHNKKVAKKENGEDSSS